MRAEAESGLTLSTASEVVARARLLAELPGRRLLGIAGPPGCGKSTLAETLVDSLPGDAVSIPMDGFHLAGAVLEQLGRTGRKGAPDTFDAAGYVALLKRLQANGEAVVYAPEFRRDLEEPIASAIAVPINTSLVITEGNYLLLDIEPWNSIRLLLDETWYIDIDDTLRRKWLIERHVRHGRSRPAARKWVLNTDEPNADIVKTTRSLADVLIPPAPFLWPDSATATSGVPDNESGGSLRLRRSGTPTRRH